MMPYAFFMSFIPSIPSIDIVPADGLDKPISILMVEVLPAPLGPKKPNISPYSISKEIPSTALRSP